jgi:hypothetical protein
MYFACCVLRTLFQLSLDVMISAVRCAHCLFSRVIDEVATCYDTNLVRDVLMGLVINNNICIRGKSGCWHMINFFWFHHKHSVCAFCFRFVVTLAHASEILSKGHLPGVGSNRVIH